MYFRVVFLLALVFVVLPTGYGQVNAGTGSASTEGVTTEAPKTSTKMKPKTSTAAPMTTVKPSTAAPVTTVKPSTAAPVTTVKPTTAQKTTVKPTTAQKTTVKPTTAQKTTVKPTTAPMTTVKPTTQKKTTAAVTTMAKTTKVVTTMVQTTEAMTTIGPAKIGKYVVMDPKTKQPCLIAEMTATFNIQYELKNKSMSTAMLELPTMAAVTGMCANGSDNATINIQFGENALMMKFEQDPNASSKKAKIAAISLMYNLDVTNFPNAMNQTQNFTSKNEKLDFMLSSPTTFFSCKSPTTVTIDKSASMMTEDLQIQAFDLNKGNFSGTGEQCPADTPTPSPKPPTPPPTPKTGNFSAKGKDGVYCIYSQLGIRFNIMYTKKGGENGTAIVDLPTNATTVNSVCADIDPLTQKLVMEFNRWTFQLWFTRENNKSDASYSLKTSALTYLIEGSAFPNASDPGKAITVKKTNVTYQDGTLKVGQSYMCTAKQDLNLGMGVDINTWNFKVQAFGTSNKTGFTGNPVDCEADTGTTSNIVPIAVGAALAGLVIIVLIAYLIGRRKSRKGYESV